MCVYAQTHTHAHARSLARITHARVRVICEHYARARVNMMRARDVLDEASSLALGARTGMPLNVLLGACVCARTKNTMQCARLRPPRACLVCTHTHADDVTDNAFVRRCVRVYAFVCR